MLVAHLVARSEIGSRRSAPADSIPTTMAWLNSLSPTICSGRSLDVEPAAVAPRPASEHSHAFGLVHTDAVSRRSLLRASPYAACRSPLIPAALALPQPGRRAQHP